ncbi:phosphoinositide 3-kinase adapter protein 1 isoform X1 [Oryzias melastigma]|uniref:phosphoinositide 3-kinase adapter protein 1 isoform X1 n=2 Tax=Oryzias melastigma TaxID=30732 RepID=UPI00168D50A3|nr:phosphoinositide 3-kinase adapter protein 1 isoform X1 [Oryzias melastigma]
MLLTPTTESRTMNESISSTKSGHSESTCEVLILHTSEAHEWATYLQQVLKSHKLHRKSVLLYSLSSADQLHGYNFANFQSSKCVVLLLSAVFLDMLQEQNLQQALQGFLQPPHRVVVLFCGVFEEDVLKDTFRDWISWRKIFAEDEPDTYVSTIMAAVTDSRQAEAMCENEAAAVEPPMAVPSAHENPSEEAADSESAHVEPSGDEVNPSEQLTCLTVQPSRIQCEKREKLFIVLTTKVSDAGSGPEVEFSSEKGGSKRLCGTMENEYTISVTAPEMSAGLVSLTLYIGQSCISLTPVTYYTCMGEVSRYLEQAADPLKFICQAFNLTSNATESVDEILNESLKSKMPESGLQLFGVKQIETDNMSANQRDEEVPTLLHFAAKYGLKKLTTTLLHSPGALQAYSVMNKHGDYPNTLAEKNGFGDLRRFMDEFVETADMLKSHLEDAANIDGDIYEAMSNNSQDMMMKYSGSSEDIYESMLRIDPECAEDLYEAMSAVDTNPEEALLRTFFQAKPQAPDRQVNNLSLQSEEEQRDGPTSFLHDEREEEENPYNLCPEDIYDIVDAKSTYNPAIVNRPPAPVPRPESALDPEKRKTYISRVFSDKDVSRNSAIEAGYPPARPAVEAPISTYDPYAGMKTPGQRQLISLQERVKVGEITVEEAVQEFRAWQFDHERRASSLRYQQENLKKLRDSITRRHKEREKVGKDLEYEISAPLQRNLYWGSNLECGVYEPSPRISAPPPPPVHTIQRGTWKTGSTSSTSSTDSNRLSTFSCSSGTEPEFEKDAAESLPPRPQRPSDPLPVPPPRIPPRIPERVPEVVHERYIPCPTRALPNRPMNRDMAPPVPRRQR